MDTFQIIKMVIYDQIYLNCYRFIMLECVCVCVCVCVHAHACVHACMHAYDFFVIFMYIQAVDRIAEYY